MNSSDKAKRFNEGKVDYTLIPINAQRAEARVWMLGEKKYGRYNWQKLWGSDTVPVVMGCLLRHAYAILEGEDYDKESGQPHAAHIRANAAMLIEHLDRIQQDVTSHTESTGEAQRIVLLDGRS
jgi:hypothetical protein